ncbi:DUF2806 domain-containing protein [Roseivirga pacifica]|uniref:DUF2806 domain-containing protein n=1 Tax=Roseivirga pacifica TaxID=1267423 RepID=UPI003BAFA8A5
MSNSNLPEKENEIKTWLGQFIQDLTTIKLPEVAERNLVRSVSKLITGFLDIPAAYLHEIKRRIERETEAQDLILRANAKDVVELNRKDQEFIANTASYYSIQQFKEAGNRRAVLEKAINELEDRAISEDAKEEIDEDWLAKFAKIANDVSKEDVQLILAKILAGEIVNPGSFSTMALAVLERFDRKAAKQFAELSNHICNVETGTGLVIIATKTTYSGGLIRRGLVAHEIQKMLNPKEYPRIDSYSLLVDVGVLRPFISTRLFNPTEFIEFKVGSTKVGLISNGQFAVPLERQNDKPFKCIELTTAGYELLPFLETGQCPEKYFKELAEFLSSETSHDLIKH